MTYSTKGIDVKALNVNLAHQANRIFITADSVSYRFNITKFCTEKYYNLGVHFYNGPQAKVDHFIIGDTRLKRFFNTLRINKNA